jgi:hypothetical protein
MHRARVYRARRRGRGRRGWNSAAAMVVTRRVIAMRMRVRRVRMFMAVRAAGMVGVPIPLQFGALRSLQHGPSPVR